MLPSIYDVIEKKIFLNYFKTKKRTTLVWMIIHTYFNKYDFGQIFDTEMNEDIKIK